jgi:hypothetical protein
MFERSQDFLHSFGCVTEIRTEKELQWIVDRIGNEKDKAKERQNSVDVSSYNNYDVNEASNVDSNRSEQEDAKCCLLPCERVKMSNQITKNRTEAIAVLKEKQIANENRANSKSNLEDQAWEMKIVFETIRVTP